jgi:hypothetical protein
MAEYFPSRRKPVRRTVTRRGFSLRRVVAGSRPSFSSTPGRKGSMRMSTVGIRERRRESEAGDLRSRVMEDL